MIATNENPVAIYIPVLCSDSRCGVVWMYDVAGGDLELLRAGCTVTPCPSCGSVGTVPDGCYTTVAGLSFRENQLWCLIKVLVSLQRLLAKTGPAIDTLLIAQNPVLAMLEEFLPRDVLARAGYLSILTALLAFYLRHRCDELPTVVVPKRIFEALRKLASQCGMEPPPWEED